MAQALSDDELLVLVDRLADGQWHSGEALAAVAGISRAALAKRIARLADWQLSVEGRQGLGYRLATPLERLDPERLRAAVPTMAVTVLPVTDSTNTRIMAAPAQQDPQVILAEYQSAARGRRGRQWLSPFGAQLALSLAWSFDAMPPQLGALPLAVGVVCAEVLRRSGLDAVGLKWPNDIVVGDRKLGGILLEHRGEGAGACRIVIGIGLNLCMRSDVAEAVHQPWINLDDALQDAGREPVGRNALAADLLRALHELLAGYATSGFAPWQRRWQGFDVAEGRMIRVLQGQVDRVVRACGVDADGALIVESDGRREHLYSGELSMRLA